MNTTSGAAVLALTSFLAACAAGAAAPATPEPTSSQPDVHQTVAAPAPTAADLEQGEATFRDVCTQCHTTDPPPNLAPPMRMVSMHLRALYPTREAAVRRVVSYVRQPDASRSVLPAHAVERFGLMPAQQLPPELLQNVAAYVWTLAGDLPTMGREHGRMRMPGRGAGAMIRVRRGGGG